MPQGLRIVKNNLISAPPIFRLIQEAAGTDWREMYQVFNMGQRLEIFTDEATANDLVDIAASLKIDAQISGRVEAAPSNELIIEGEFGTYKY